MFPRFLTSIVSWRSVAVLAVVASVLQVTNVVLTWQLRQRQLISMAGEKNTALGPKTGLRENIIASVLQLSDDHQAILTRIAHWSVLDGSGEFRVSTGVVRGTEGGQGEEQEAATQGLTLVTQCSFTRLQRLPPLASHWQGPISIAVFALSGEVQAVVQTFHLLRKCYPEVRANVTFSLVFPLNSPTSPHLTPTTDATPCDRIFSSARQPNYDFKGVQYPNNLLRNVARKATITRLMMVVDIDMIPGEGLHDAFVSYAGRQGLFGENSGEEKTVWVVPRYTDYPAWEKKSEVKAGKVEPLYEVLWQDPWEPFYIASTKVPLYDERFRQYGFNRISQVCELHVAGYRFLVLDSAFVIHRGFKTNTGFHTTKDVEQERNRILFRQFKGELKERYPESSRRCY
ncbi:Beta-1-4-glucuronyltransferase 1-like 4 [Homarus americanus]|uniref:Beta-1,4-glucuronyltransferase 1 n=1 Tax=Homarus americanus TaxID=6706 RepID=A0A8J5MMV9_HOMAM|nr:Beta-1-4-glucuronyltransferase 1-like 4 [Homarus americanus]